MTDSQRDEILNKLGDIDPALAESFSKSSDPEKWLREANLEGYSEFTDNYESLDDFIGDRDKILAKLYQNMDGKIPSGARMQSFREKHPEISEEDIVAWFNKTNQYREDELKAKRYEYDRMKRAEEVKNMSPITSMFVSDYSKKRYIDDPSTSILGGSQFNPYSSEGQKEIRDQLLGASAGVADFIPGFGGVVAGPVIRSGRDVAHMDEKYKPEENILTNFTKDVAFNAGVEYLPTAVLRKLGKAERGASASNWIGDAYYTKNLDKELATNQKARNLAQEALSRQEEKAMTGTSLGEKELWNDIRRLPDSEFKKLVEAELAKGKRPSAALNSVEFNYKTYESAPIRELNEKLAQRGNLYTSNETSTDLIRRDILRPELSVGQDWARFAMGLSDQVGPGLVKMTGLGKTREVNADEALKEWYKSNYTRDWAMGFSPHYKPADPLWEAFKETYPERAAKIEEKEKNK
jgi:hypothetical protein